MCPVSFSWGKTHQKLTKSYWITDPRVNYPVVSNMFYVHPHLGKIPILTNIFQRGWNHQLETVVFFGWLRCLCLVCQVEESNTKYISLMWDFFQHFVTWWFFHIFCLLNVHPYVFGEDVHPFWRSHIFSKGLVQPQLLEPAFSCLDVMDQEWAEKSQAQNINLSL